MAVKLTIDMDDAGQISVNGPIDNKLLSYGLLALAQEAIAKFHDSKERKEIQLAPASALGALKPRN